jgi:hypothetical protein
MAVLLLPPVALARVDPTAVRRVQATVSASRSAARESGATVTTLFRVHAASTAPTPRGRIVVRVNAPRIDAEGPNRAGVSRNPAGPNG